MNYFGQNLSFFNRIYFVKCDFNIYLLFFGVFCFIDLNQPAIFTCTVTGYPRQHVYWIKNGQTFQLDGHR